MGFTEPEIFAQCITLALRQKREELRCQWLRGDPFRFFVVDDLLPEKIPGNLDKEIPSGKEMIYRHSLRERKRTAIDLQSSPGLKQLLFAFQHSDVVEAVESITGLPALQADPSLYASGVSVMTKGDFLNPHIDNSHDGDQRLYRSVNLLYYISPEWEESFGGNLELWDPSVTHPSVVVSRFNRLVVMETHETSWHSVNKVLADRRRCCVSNYFFSAKPTRGEGYRHVTTFSGRPEQPFRRLFLGVMDGLVLNALGRAAPILLNLTKHRLKKT